MTIASLYYIIKGFIPRRVQIGLRSRIVLRKRLSVKKVWPIDEEARKRPDNWPGWPERKKFAFILTHDVDTARGAARCRDLMDIELMLGFRSSFNFVPERYTLGPEIRHELTLQGFEVGVHGLKHDGKLYNSRRIFRRRAYKINGYIKDWQAVGFRSPSMHHMLDWLHDLHIEYDASTFDTDPFEPQSDGVKTIFPFWVQNGTPGVGYVELPYTLPQDFTLFVLMKEKGIGIWRRKLDWIARHGGMALINVHPDYMNFSDCRNGIEEYPARYYRQCLEYIKENYAGQYWHALPKDVARFYSSKVRSLSSTESGQACQIT